MIFLPLFFLEICILFSLSRVLSRTLSRFLSIQFLSLLFLPGVIVHELSHLLVAGVLFVPIGEIEFLPKRVEGGVKLGSVGIGKTDPIRRAIVGLAPILVGVLSLFAIASFYFAGSYELFTWQTLLPFYASFQIGNTMFSSAKDLEGFLELVLVVGFFTLVFYVFTRLTNISVSLPAFPADQIGAVLQPLVIALGIVIVLDVLIVGTLRIVRR